VLADFGLLEQWAAQDAGADRAIVIGLRTVAGLKAKVDVLADLINAGIPQVRGSLRLRAEKYGKKSVKYARPKAARRRIADNELDHAFEDKFGRLRTQRDKTLSLIRRIEAYDRYDRFSLDNEPMLWWHELSGGRPTSALVPRYQRWYASHPGLQPSLQDLEEEASQARAVAMARTAQTLEKEQYLS
jgi:hypothetical protein